MNSSRSNFLPGGLEIFNPSMETPSDGKTDNEMSSTETALWVPASSLGIMRAFSRSPVKYSFAPTAAARTSTTGIDRTMIQIFAGLPRGIRHPFHENNEI